jgi:hypothetical protein
MDDATTCRLCGAALPEDGGLRCPNCGLHRVADLGRPGVRRLAVGLAGLYGVTALLVFLTRGS